MVTLERPAVKTLPERIPSEVCDGDWDFFFDCLKGILDRMKDGVRRQRNPSKTYHPFKCSISLFDRLALNYSYTFDRWRAAKKHSLRTTSRHARTRPRLKRRHLRETSCASNFVFVKKRTRTFLYIHVCVHLLQEVTFQAHSWKGSAASVCANDLSKVRRPYLSYPIGTVHNH